MRISLASSSVGGGGGASSEGKVVRISVTILIALSCNSSLPLLKHSMNATMFC